MLCDGLALLQDGTRHWVNQAPLLRSDADGGGFVGVVLQGGLNATEALAAQVLWAVGGPQARVKICAKQRCHMA
jgi:hypothetical protein